MARVTVRVDDLEHGFLPAVCAKTGVPCDTTVRAQWHVVPGWTWVLFVFGIVPFLIARVVAGERVEAPLPVTTKVFTRQRWASRAALVLLLGGIGSLVGAVLEGSALIAWAGVACLGGAAVGAWLSERWWVGLVSTRRRSSVTMTRVHRNFARAVDDMYHASLRDVGGLTHLS
jgi:hypothetical protein